LADAFGIDTRFAMALLAGPMIMFYSLAKRRRPRRS